MAFSRVDAIARIKDIRSGHGPLCGDKAVFNTLDYDTKMWLCAVESGHVDALIEAFDITEDEVELPEPNDKER